MEGRCNNNKNNYQPIMDNQYLIELLISKIDELEKLKSVEINEAMDNHMNQVYKIINP